MLSILIPIYNFDVRDFVRQLQQQCLVETNLDWEILLLDDLSEESARVLNRSLAHLEGVAYEELEKNIGRSAIRNALVRNAKYEYLLIVDCDGACPDDQYISRYLKHLEAASVIYGGRIYPSKEEVTANNALHWGSGSKREVVSAAKRSERPHASFMTNNFLIQRKVYDLVKMDESLTGYGHEDTLFALELKSKGVAIDHIDNPLIHIGLETSDVFLDKTRQGIRNLAMLVKRNSLGSSVTLVAFYQKLKAFGLIPLLFLFGKVLDPSLQKHLLSSNPNLKLFDFYKLYHFALEMSSADGHK